MTLCEEWAKEMCDLVGEFAKCHISTDTPMFEFQQSIIAHCRKYKEAIQTCSDSGATWARSRDAL